MAQGVPDQDPLAFFNRPPPNETPAERRVREAKEVEAKRISDQIDEQLKADRGAWKKKNIVRVLLLGQAESGKSTALKNLRMRYARDAWIAERASWRSIIQLNLIRSILTILDTLHAEMGKEIPESHLSNVSKTATSRDSMPRQFIKSDSSSSLLTGKHQVLNLRLEPLRRIEADLKKRLGAQADEAEESLTASQTSFRIEIQAQLAYQRKKEFGVGQLTQALEQGLVSQHATQMIDEGQSNMTTDGTVDEATEVIASCKDDMVALWSDQAVQTVLKNCKIRLEDSAGFFLNDLERIASRSYDPSDDDIIRARLRTLGVQEHKIVFRNPSTIPDHNPGSEFDYEWRLYEIGGSLTTRQAWLPYFDNIQAIIFCTLVTPDISEILSIPGGITSCFSFMFRSSEDSKVNRLEDSFLLWQTVCASKLLARVNKILFLSEADLLKQKLNSGVKVNDYLPSYGDRANDLVTFVRYLRTKFMDIFKEFSTEEQRSCCHVITAIDATTTDTIVHAVKDTILRDHIRQSSLT